MPSATGQNWEKYKKEFVDDEEPEKKITPLTDEYVVEGSEERKACLRLVTDMESSGISKCSRPMALHHMQLASND